MWNQYEMDEAKYGMTEEEEYDLMMDMYVDEWAEEEGYEG